MNTPERSSEPQQVNTILSSYQRGDGEREQETLSGFSPRLLLTIHEDLFISCFLLEYFYTTVCPDHTPGCTFVAVFLYIIEDLLVECYFCVI